MRVGSLFSGCGGLDLGLERAGMTVVWQVEKAPKPRSVLRHHWPDVDLHEDVCDVGRSNLAPVDLICGGFPCQDVSVAGRRAGLDGERSGLWFEFRRIVAELAPRWVLVENVPGLRSSNGGRDLATVVRGLAQLGYVGAWRSLDTQHFGPPQRRERIFFLARLHPGDPCPAEVLAIPEGLSGDPAPSRQEGEGAAGGAEGGAGGEGGGVVGTLEARTRGGGFPGTDGATSGHVVALPLTAREHKGPASAANSGNIVAHTLRAEGHDEAVGAFDWQKGNDVDNPRPSTMNVTPQVPTLSGTRKPAVTTAIPRRLTPRECERLQGLPDDHTRWGVTDDGKKVELADSPRYEMLGNAVSAVVPAWIGRRLMEALATERSA